jgi:hypothetical protein
MPRPEQLSLGTETAPVYDAHCTSLLVAMQRDRSSGALAVWPGPELTSGCLPACLTSTSRELFECFLYASPVTVASPDATQDLSIKFRDSINSRTLRTPFPALAQILHEAIY